jgi:hypothetical protein
VKSCTDDAPTAEFTCQQQAVDYKKCDKPFMYLEGLCLKSCGRCGAGCVDVPPPAPPGGAPLVCDAKSCKDFAVINGPFCLKTCGRCSPTA